MGRGATATVEARFGVSAGAKRTLKVNPITSAQPISLLQRRFGMLGVVNNRHVITVNVGWAHKLHSHQSQFVAKASQSFHTLFYGHEFGSKDASLNSGLFLREPDDGRHIQYNDKAHSRLTCYFVPCMIRVDEHAEIDVLAPWSEGLPTSHHHRNASSRIL